MGDEGDPLGDPAERLVERRLEVGRKGEVLDLPAAGADPVMMVVLGELLGQLEAGEVRAGDEAVHDTGAFEDGDAPVGGALRQLPSPLEELGERQRATGLVEGFDDGTVVAGVALPLAAQSGFGHGVEVDHDLHPSEHVKSQSYSQNLPL